MEAVILSHALDTNGQNYRFVQAARKHGRDPDVLRALAIGQDDPAGVVARYAIAAEKLGGLSIRSAHRASHYFDFPHDIIWTRHTEKDIRELAERADVIHLNNSFRPAQRFHLRKPTLLHHHGSLFRSNPGLMLQVAHRGRWLNAVSTIDLQRPAPDELHWLPSAYDIDALQAFGKEHERAPDGRVLIAHCPTNRDLKHTDLFLAAVSELQAEGLPIAWELIEGKTWEESLKAKARADIVYDQLLYGYGCNSIEAWALGKPVIAGADYWTRRRMLSLWKRLPFIYATVESLKDTIRGAVTEADVRAEYAERGLAHVRRYHDEKPALERLAELYHMAIREFRGSEGRTAQEAVTFRSKRRIRMDDVEIAGRGLTEVTDPLAIMRLRRLAKTRPNLGVEEVVNG